MSESLARLRTEDLSAMYGELVAVKNVSLSFAPNQVHALIGPSGCGKSTFLRTINRMHETVPGAWIEGRVLLDGQNIYSSKVSAIKLRRRIGMVFQKPTPFPFMSIAANVASGLVLDRTLSKSQIAEVVERSLQRAALWNEVKDRLHTSAMGLSGGQQQRLCLARSIAPEPEVILLDEPTASLDPLGTQRIEELVFDLKREFTIVIVTHNMQQAARVADRTAFFTALADEGTGDRTGVLVEFGKTTQIFEHPTDQRTEDYISGRFG